MDLVYQPWWRVLLVVGLCLLSMSAVALAQEPVAPTVTPTPEAVVTPTPEPTLTATPTVTETPTPTPTAFPEVIATPTVTSTPIPTPTPTPEPRRLRPRQAQLTICSYTGDPAAPYVTVVIPADEYSPYFDEETAIIPAPPEGCGDIVDPDAAAAQPVTICHATGGGYELIEHPNGDLGGHETHDGDLVPAPNGTCPGLGDYAVPSQTPAPERTPESAPTAEASPVATASPEPQAVEPLPIADVLDLVATDNATAATEVSGTWDRELPFTGAEVWLVALLGAGFVLTGWGGRVLLSRPTA